MCEQPHAMQSHKAASLFIDTQKLKQYKLQGVI